MTPLRISCNMFITLNNEHGINQMNTRKLNNIISKLNNNNIEFSHECPMNFYVKILNDDYNAEYDLEDALNNANVEYQINGSLFFVHKN